MSLASSGRRLSLPHCPSGGPWTRIPEQWYCHLEGIFPFLSKDPIPFLLGFPVFSFGELFSEGSSVMESRAVVLAPTCMFVRFEFMMVTYH